MISHQPPSEIALLEEMQQFLHSAVHDLRAARRSAGVAAELLLESNNEPNNEPERAASAAQLLQGLSRMDDLLAAIGRYAQAMTPHRYHIRSFPAASAVRFALANLERDIRKTGAVVDVGDMPEIVGDHERIVELLEHILGNSLKFRRADPPRIEITAHSLPGRWRFSIKDNGQGIPAKYRDRLFTPFRRLHGADVPGSGLGLATARKIAEAHGGSMTIDGGDGPGVTISVFLPGVFPPGPDGDERAPV